MPTVSAGKKPGLQTSRPVDHVCHQGAVSSATCLFLSTAGRTQASCTLVACSCVLLPMYLASCDAIAIRGLLLWGRGVDGGARNAQHHDSVNTPTRQPAVTEPASSHTAAMCAFAKPLSRSVFRQILLLLAGAPQSAHEACMTQSSCVLRMGGRAPDPSHGHISS